MAALLALVPANASAACVKDGEELVKRSGLVDVLVDGEGAHVACLRRTGRRTELDAPEDDVSVEPEHGIRISGHFVSYVTRTIFPAGEEDSVGLDLTDVRNGRAYPVDGQTCPGWPDWTMTGRGSVAYIREDCEKASRREVWRCRLGCREGDRLDRGAIAPRSLRRRGDRVLWRKGGARRSALFR